MTGMTFVSRNPCAGHKVSEFFQSLHHRPSFPFMRKVYILRHLHMQFLYRN